MSHIPNKVMPHAGHIEEAHDEEHDTVTVKARAASLREKVRANPKPAIAAGATVLAAAVAAAAIPFIGRNWKTEEKTAAKKSGGQAKAKKTAKA